MENKKENFIEQLMEEIWNDANFTVKKIVKQSGETIKKNSIRKMNTDGKIVAYCKVCNSEMFISTNYNGEFPLCRIHRDPNDRPLNETKIKKDATKRIQNNKK